MQSLLKLLALLFFFVSQVGFAESQIIPVHAVLFLAGDTGAHAFLHGEMHVDRVTKTGIAPMAPGTSRD